MKNQDKSLIMDINAILPYGKYKGKSLLCIMNEDANYYHWMKKNYLIDKWGLTKTRKSCLVEDKYLYDQDFLRAGI